MYLSSGNIPPSFGQAESQGLWEILISPLLKLLLKLLIFIGRQ